MQFGTVTYASDDGNQYDLRVSRATFDASDLAGGNATLPPYPHQWYPRQVHGINVTDGVTKHASIPVNEAGDLWQGDQSQFTKAVDGADVVFQITGRTGEKRPRLAAPFV